MKKTIQIEAENRVMKKLDEYTKLIHELRNAKRVLHEVIGEHHAYREIEECESDKYYQNDYLQLLSESDEFARQKLKLLDEFFSEFFLLKH